MPLPTTTTTPTFPLPASARVHPTTTIPTATAPGKVISPATTAPLTTSTQTTTGAGRVATLPTTTVPSGSTVHRVTVTHTSAPQSNTLSTGAIVLVVVAALLVLACIGWALARRRAFEPHWLLSLRHAMAEAGFRASATWAEFSDWVRLGH